MVLGEQWVGNEAGWSLDVGGDDPHPAMPEIDEVLGCLACAGSVVDVDAGNAGGGDLVDEHERHFPTLQPIDAGGVAVARIHERPIHGHVASRYEVTLLAGRQQCERE